MPWDITWKDFFISFWPGFWSSIITGGIIGFYFSWFLAKKIGKILLDEERRLTGEDERIKKKIITQSFYENMLESIENFLGVAGSAITELSEKNIDEIETKMLIYVDIMNKFWSSLLTNTEVQKYIPPDVLFEYFILHNVFSIEKVALQKKTGSLEKTKLYIQNLADTLETILSDTKTKYENFKNLDFKVPK